ncbi:MAG: ABC transporter ATP-binding protein [Patescibacteria group bacterium]
MWKLYKTYYSFLYKYRFRFLSFMVLVLLWGLSEAVIPYFYKLFVDAIPSGDYQLLLKILIAYAGLYVVEIILNAGSIFVGDTFLLPAARDARVAVFKKIQDLDFAFHLTKSTGSLISAIKRGDQAFFSIHHIINVRMTRIFVNFVVMTIFFTSLNSSLLGIMAVTFAINISLAFLLIRYNMRTRKEFNEAEDDVSAVIVDNLLNYETVKLFAKEDKELSHLRSRFQSWLQKLWLFANSFRLIDLGVGAISNTGLFLVLFIGLGQTIRGELTGGEYIAMLGYVSVFYYRFFELIYELRNFAKHHVDLVKYFSWLPLKEQVKDPAEPVTLENVKGKIKFENTSFSYPEGKQGAIRDFDLTIKPGQSVAFVGHSGAGKTTVTKLLMRFYDPNSGKITIDGVDLKKMTKSHLRSHMGVVPQEPIMFNNTIAFNIAYGALDVTEEKIIEAAKMANLHDFISTMPKAYKTNVGERGVKLSGGQKQRLAIARMILSDPEIIIFDEATSQLDSESEKLIQDAFWKAAKGKTTLIIAHRLSSITKAEKIVVMEDGEIREIGSHKQLLTKKSSLYKKFWQLQTVG